MILSIILDCLLTSLRASSCIGGIQFGESFAPDSGRSSLLFLGIANLVHNTSQRDYLWHPETIQSSAVGISSSRLDVTVRLKQTHKIRELLFLTPRDLNLLFGNSNLPGPDLPGPAMARECRNAGLSHPSYLSLEVEWYIHQSRKIFQTEFNSSSFLY